MEKYSNARYDLIPSGNDKLKEVSVTYTVKGRLHHYFIFLQKKNKMTDKDYIKEAKKQFNEHYKSGRVNKVTKGDSSKPVLVTLTSIFGVAAVALGGFLGYKYLTGGFNGGGSGGGGGGGDEPEPIVWKDATQEEILVARDNVITAHTGKNPFVFLSQLNGTQYKVTHHYFMEGGKMNDNGDDETTTYEIDTNAFYIKKRYTAGVTDKITYITCREYEDSSTGFTGYKVYECYDDEESNTKTNIGLYTWPTFDEALKAFTEEHWDATVKDYAKGIYGTEFYEYDDKEHVDWITDSIDSYLFLLSQIPGLDIPDIAYQKGNSTSFKFTHAISEASAESSLDAKFTFDMENSLLKSRYQKIDLSMGEEKIFNLIDDFKVETTSFTPDNLDEYFSGK